MRRLLQPDGSAPSDAGGRGEPSSDWVCAEEIGVITPYRAQVDKIKAGPARHVYSATRHPAHGASAGRGARPVLGRSNARCPSRDAISRCSSPSIGPLVGSRCQELTRAWLQSYRSSMRHAIPSPSGKQASTSSPASMSTSSRSTRWTGSRGGRRACVRPRRQPPGPYPLNHPADGRLEGLVGWHYRLPSPPNLACVSHTTRRSCFAHTSLPCRSSSSRASARACRARLPPASASSATRGA